MANRFNKFKVAITTWNDIFVLGYKYIPLQIFIYNNVCENYCLLNNRFIINIKKTALLSQNGYIFLLNFTFTNVLLRHKHQPQLP